MATSPLAGIVGYLRGLGGGREDALADRELLLRFVAQRDEAAFALLLQRYGPLVLSVCRQVLRDAHEAEDAFQATFLLLARKATTIRRGEALGAWLHRVACNVARTARADATRRRASERRAILMSRADAAPESSFSDWQPLLHEEVNRLPGKYRLPIVLSYLEGKTHEEAARELGWPVGTVKGRLARARDLLRTRLARRGLALPAAGLTALLAQGTVQAAVPAALADSTLRAALLFAAGSVTVRIPAALLAERMLKVALLKKVVATVFFLCVAAALAAGGALFAPRIQETPVLLGKEPERPAGERIVFAGDSSTDGNTYLLLIRQALARAGRPVPGCINAGVSTDTARGVRRRLERDVLVHKPTRVVLAVGTHDALRNETKGVPVADYEADVRAIAEQLRAGNIPFLLMTPSLVGPRFTAAEPRLAEYSAVLRRLAGEFGCPLADGHRLLREARAAGRAVVEADNVHPNYEGQRLLARAVLDALGHSDVPVPRQLSLSPLPGILKEWHLRIAPGGKEPLNDHLVAALDPPGPGWTLLTLPEPVPEPSWWREQERQRGFALSLERRLGKALLYLGVAHLEADRPRDAFLLTGAALKGVWLNGRRVYRNTTWTGWHAGKERLPVRLRGGRNVLVIECGTEFFLSVSDDAELSQERPSERMKDEG
jgi:RNA polymerase sigma factor (sigma-70 family)